MEIVKSYDLAFAKTSTRNWEIDDWHIEYPCFWLATFIWHTHICRSTETQHLFFFLCSRSSCILFFRSSHQPRKSQIAYIHHIYSSRSHRSPMSNAELYTFITFTKTKTPNGTCTQNHHLSFSTTSTHTHSMTLYNVFIRLSISCSELIVLRVKFPNAQSPLRKAAFSN